MECYESQWVELFINHLHLLKINGVWWRTRHLHFDYLLARIFSCICLEIAWVLTVKRWLFISLVLLLIHVSNLILITFLDVFVQVSCITLLISITVRVLFALSTLFSVTTLIVITKLLPFQFSGTSSEVSLLLLLSISQEFNVFAELTISFNGL